MTTIIASAGDYGYEITDTLENDDGTPFDLTGYLVKFVCWPPGNPAAVVIDAAAVVNAAPTTGAVSYTVAKTDFPSPIILAQEWQAISGTAIIQSFPVGGNTIRILESA